MEFGGEHAQMVTLSFLMQREILKLFHRDQPYTIFVPVILKLRRIT
jgi:hypothetical protein